MEEYILGNKAAWEEAFENRVPSWGADIARRVQNGAYAFFNDETAETLQKYDLKDKVVGQFCSNNGRELLSLVKSGGAKRGVGFDIAKNQVEFANAQAKALHLPCEFIETNALEIGEEYRECFDMALLTIGALCWFKDLNQLFAVISNCMKPGAILVINEQHPFLNMLAASDEEEYDSAHPANCLHSYFEHEWIGNEGMYYMTRKVYRSKTFTDYTHPLADIVGAICNHQMAVTGLRELDYDIGGDFEALNGKGLPLSMILEAKKAN